MGLIEQIAAADNIQAAWAWLASRRKNSHHRLLAFTSSSNSVRATDGCCDSRWVLSV
ncbi:MAG: hypothetical protein OIF49_15995 [Thiotrichaceae bacterium]|nr:hypothetical protein [Thiotrichaceae bacterium]